MITTKQTGTLKFMNKTSGYGFIKTEENGDVFVHITDVCGEINRNDFVEFDIEETPKGKKATNVCLNNNKV